VRTTTHFLRFALSICLMYGCTTGSGQHVGSRTLESQVRERSTHLVAAEAAKDFEKAIAFWLPEAVVHLEGAETIRGLTAIRRTYGQFFQTVRSFRGEIESVTIASSGDLAYETGTNYMTVESPSGTATAATSKYLAVWKRGEDSEWRLAAVAITSNPAK
jgi:ketosteroid isomerase-like protein